MHFAAAGATGLPPNTPKSIETEILAIHEQAWLIFHGTSIVGEVDQDASKELVDRINSFSEIHYDEQTGVHLVS